MIGISIFRVQCDRPRPAPTISGARGYNVELIKSAVQELNLPGANYEFAA